MATRQLPKGTQGKLKKIAGVNSAIINVLCIELQIKTPRHPILLLAIDRPIVIQVSINNLAVHHKLLGGKNMVKHSSFAEHEMKKIVIILKDQKNGRLVNILLKQQQKIAHISETPEESLTKKRSNLNKKTSVGE